MFFTERIRGSCPACGGDVFLAAVLKVPTAFGAFQCRHCRARLGFRRAWVLELAGVLWGLLLSALWLGTDWPVWAKMAAVVLGLLAAELTVGLLIIGKNLLRKL